LFLKIKNKKRKEIKMKGAINMDIKEELRKTKEELRKTKEELRKTKEELRLELRYWEDESMKEEQCSRVYDLQPQKRER